MLEKIPDILHFWFGEGEAGYAEMAPKWWKKDPAFDQAIKQKFESLFFVEPKALEPWKTLPSGLLALIVLYDQFPRNIYRDTPQSFAFDDKALSLSNLVIEHKWDKDLHFIERVFSYMPFQHSEELADQKHSVALFKNLVDEAELSGSPWLATLKNNYTYAFRHYEIIDRFGRFPHRNRILNRESTELERVFLSQPNSSF